MNERIERNKEDAIIKVFDKLVLIIKDRLLIEKKESFIRISDDGKLKLMGYGVTEEKIFDFNDDELLKSELEHFKAYTIHKLSLSASHQVYNKHISQNWKIMIDDTLLNIQSNAENNTIDIKIVI